MSFNCIYTGLVKCHLRAQDSIIVADVVLSFTTCADRYGRTVLALIGKKPNCMTHLLSKPIQVRIATWPSRIIFLRHCEGLTARKVLEVQLNLLCEILQSR